ncbi:hypothetical protein OOJ96_01150 [Pseudomonas sp. 15FMM2]|uniref:Uncharacterized protein n=1 Tax=Pseudomonas imrae TaxID=2992837 RepID=A0ACC7P6M0_9PSED
MANRQNYTVLIPFPTGGGHWSTVGQELDLLDVEASALHTAGRLELTSELGAVKDTTQAKQAVTEKAE